MNCRKLTLALPLCLTLAAGLAAQDSDRTQLASPQVSVAMDAGWAKLSVSADRGGSGFLILLGSFTGETHSLGLGLPDVLRYSQVMAIEAYPRGDAIAVSHPRPPIDVLLQAVQVQFKPTFAVTASSIIRIPAAGEASDQTGPRTKTDESGDADTRNRSDAESRGR